MAFRRPRIRLILNLFPVLKVPIFITLLEYQDVRKLVIKYRAKFLIQTTTKIYFLPLFIDNFRKEFTRIILIS